MIERKLLPRKFGILPVVEDVVGMYQHREFLQGDLTQFRLAVNRLCNPARHDQRFEGHTGQNIHRFGITLPFTEQNTDSAGPTAVNRHVKISEVLLESTIFL